MPVTEALACGRPVVTTTASSLPEAGGDAAWLVPPGDVPALAAALAAALRPDPSRCERGLAHAARFTWAATALQTAATYRRALGQIPA
jgi:glycosyltransferase involved in cell wall biosynthesis